jgi:ATP-dependent Lon protease
MTEKEFIEIAEGYFKPEEMSSPDLPESYLKIKKGALKKLVNKEIS